MKGILLRGLCEVVVYVLTLPLRLIVIIAAICYLIYGSIRYERSFMEGLKAFVITMKASFSKEINWVKTGNCKDF